MCVFVCVCGWGEGEEGGELHWDAGRNHDLEIVICSLNKEVSKTVLIQIIMFLYKQQFCVTTIPPNTVCLSSIF